MITARNLPQLRKSAASDGWTVTQDHPQSTDFTKGDRLFVVFHATAPNRFDHAYRCESANRRDFTGTYSTLARLVERMNDDPAGRPALRLVG